MRISRFSCRALVAAGLMACAVMSTGCNQTSRNDRTALYEYEAGNYVGAARMLKPETTKKDENFVLTNCRFGSAALAAGQMDQAENAFLAAYEVINSVKTNDGGRTMGAAIVFEGIKVFKGEPFERAMADYYLGLIYLIHNEYDNARAAFRSSTFSVREYAKVEDPEHFKEVESNFALGYFGLGFCYFRQGDMGNAQTCFKRAAAIDPRLANVIQAVQQPGVNTLLFIDAGHGPHKGAKGWYNEESAFGPTPQEVGAIPPVAAWIDGQLVTPPNVSFSMLDTLAMAQERHWQDIDTLRKVKAVVGTGLMAGGAGVAAYGAERRDTGTALAGLGAVAAGALLSASSQADTRSWNMLPRTVYIVPAVLPPGPHKIMVQAGPGQSVPFEPTIQGPKNGQLVDNVFYFRLR